MIKESNKIVIIIIIIIKEIVNDLNIIGLKKTLITLKKKIKRPNILNNALKSFLGIYTQNSYFILMLSKHLL